MQTSGLAQTHIYSYFGASQAARGDYYEREKKVVIADLDEASGELRGLILTSDKDQYRANVQLSKDGKHIDDANCTCLQGSHCEHSAALLFRALRTGLLNSLEKSRATFEEEGAKSKSGLSPSFSGWVAGIEKEMGPVEARSSHQGSADSVCYLLGMDRSRMLTLSLAQLKTSDDKLNQCIPLSFELVSRRSSAFVSEDDSILVNLFLALNQACGLSTREAFPTSAETGTLLMSKLIATQRCFWHSSLESPLTFGATQTGRLFWKSTEEGRQVLSCTSSSERELIAFGGIAWYIDVENARIGTLKLPVPDAAIKSIFCAPAVEMDQAKEAYDALAALGPSFPKPSFEFNRKLVFVEPKPVLKLASHNRYCWGSRKANKFVSEPIAKVVFDYDKNIFGSASGDEVKSIVGKDFLIHTKNKDSELLYKKELESFGLSDLKSTPTPEYNTMMKFLGENSESDWLKLSSEGVTTLRNRGWHVEYCDDFPYEVTRPQEEPWTADWFSPEDGDSSLVSLDLGITIDGKRHQLLPILQAALSKLSGNDMLGSLDSLNVDGVFYAPLPDKRHVALPFERIKAIVSVLLELFEERGESTLKVTLFQLVQLADCGTDFHWDRRLRRLISRIKNYDGSKEILPPSSFKAELRPYQSEGLSWLNFLREFKLGGILADDMGLGKTVQTLAHICLEKEEGRLQKPYLIICPTSVLPNWRSEIEKFAPHLSVTVAWGMNRYSVFGEIKNSDIILTTYTLVLRDVKVWLKQRFSAVILDEAQAIKNPRTLLGQVVCRLKADYRLSLTGTPVENNLQDLWTQFNFLSKGLLKDLSTFNRLYRFPIERENDKVLLKKLQLKLKPFILRRTKELVAKDLPEKTIIIKKVELDGEQRDLYEALRLSMFERVKDTLACKGLGGSQLIFLDALLKLRQVCCDPRLVSLEAAKSITSSAKLDLLLDMLEELVSEGRRVLLFSQFTGMLDLIGAELIARNIEFVEIRGSTIDRATPVKTFQEGQVPIFLLSLKAGGTGLNLTAADTVIHYDPWWNPSVENQATDRAHRIGQTKSVFVFKLIASDTIEEKIVELQQRKGALASGFLSEGDSLPHNLCAEDLLSLLS